jgi:hypothetical protein
LFTDSEIPFVTTVRAANPMPDLAAVAQRSRRLYAACVAGMPSATPWWTAVVITAGSVRQAERYHYELYRREKAGKIPPNVRFLVVPDLISGSAAAAPPCTLCARF